MADAVAFEHVVKRYGGVTAVDSVDFAIARGTLVTLLGPSGCGKTTTLRLIAGLEHATSGRITIDGEDVTLRSAAERDVSMGVPVIRFVPAHVGDGQRLLRLRASGVRRAEAQGRAATTLAAVGLKGFEARLPSELSGGQQQRVAVARAIVLEPKVLLFDEPLSNLDAKLRRRVREDIRALQQELALTVVYVTHDQEEALAVSDRIIVMHSARIVQDGTPRDLYERPASRFIADFIGNANILPVRVARAIGGDAQVSLGSLSLALPHRDVPAGDAFLAVRPQAIRLAPPDDAADALPATIRKAAYLGDHMEYEIVMDGVDREVFVIDPDITTPRAVGARVAARVMRGGAVLVADDARR